VCNISLLLPQLSVGIRVTIPFLPNTPINYVCDNPDFFVNGPLANECNDEGTFASLTAPTCEPIRKSSLFKSLKKIWFKNKAFYECVNEAQNKNKESKIW